MCNKNIFGVILAGGSGSRLWPLSREMHPKQLLRINGENTLFQSAFLRLAGVIPSDNILTVTNIKHQENINFQLEELKNKFSPNRDYITITEPLGRNTAPAIGLAMFYILKKLASDTDPIILVSPSDHLIKDAAKFNQIITEGIKLAEKNYIVTFGISPTKPDTGFGYIKTEKIKDVQDIVQGALKVSEFKEKPDLKTAEEYLASGKYYWNGGIFMFKASTMLNELHRFAPDIIEGLNDAELEDVHPTVNFDAYKKLNDISIDYAVMEKSNLIALLPLDCEWNDMGSWESMFDVSDRDENNNYSIGNTIDIDSKDSLIYSTSKLVSTIGLKDTVVVETDDAILVCDKSRTQDVKQVFEHLKKGNNQECVIHSTVYKPWGYYTVFQKESDFLTRTLYINPFAKIKLQKHKHRSEHWVILSGEAKVIRGDEEILLSAGQSITISAKMAHSLENPNDSGLKVLEVQNGSYISDDDIIRIENCIKN